MRERYRARGLTRATSGWRSGYELIEGARSVAQGVYVMAPFRAPMNVVDLLPQLAHEPVETGR